MNLKRPEITKLPKMLVHLSKYTNRNSILQFGILPNIGEIYAEHWMTNYPDEALTPAVFLSVTPWIMTSSAAKWYYDVWEVNTYSLDLSKLYIDPAFECSRRQAFIYFKGIPADVLNLRRKAKRNPEDDPKIIEC
jgi:hypothetical protein